MSSALDCRCGLDICERSTQLSLPFPFHPVCRAFCSLESSPSALFMRRQARAALPVLLGCRNPLAPGEEIREDRGRAEPYDHGNAEEDDGSGPRPGLLPSITHPIRSRNDDEGACEAGSRLCLLPFHALLPLSLRASLIPLSLRASLIEARRDNGPQKNGTADIYPSLPPLNRRNPLHLPTSFHISACDLPRNFFLAPRRRCSRQPRCHRYNCTSRRRGV